MNLVYINKVCFIDRDGGDRHEFIRNTVFDGFYNNSCRTSADRIDQKKMTNKKTTCLARFR